MYNDDINFESELATFTRQYASTENRKAQAWKGWLKALECQYDTEQFAEAISQLDYDFFGCDIVFLASSWGGPKFIDAVSPYVQWHRLERDENMGDSVESSRPDINSLDFSKEPSFWVWYFACEHEHPENQVYDVEYCVETLLKNGGLSMIQRLPSYSFDHDITLRTALVAWNMKIDRQPFLNIFDSPISEDEARDIVVAFCANGEDLHGMFNADDLEMVKKLALSVDYSAPYPLSQQLQSVLHTQSNELPLGIVVAGIMMRSWDHESDILAHLKSDYSTLFEQHYDFLYRLGLNENVFGRSRRDRQDSVAGQIFCNTPHFDTKSLLAPLLRDTLLHFDEHTTSKRSFQNFMMHCAAAISLPHIFSEDETTDALNKIFEIFSDRKQDNVKMEEINEWWHHPEGWNKAIEWFDPVSQSKVENFMRPMIDAGTELNNRPSYIRSIDTKTSENERQAAQILLNVFDASRWNESARKLKM